MTTRLWAGLMVLLLAGCVTARAPRMTTQGVVGKSSAGSFQLTEAGGLLRLYNLSKKLTQYAPADWRPATGDTVSVRYFELEKDDGAAVLCPEVITLVKAGPDTFRLPNPVVVQLSDIGISGYRAIAPGYEARPVKFKRHSGTRTVPVGWLPAPGDKAKITFTVREGGDMLVEELERVP
jgi:hypothetical protein